MTRKIFQTLCLVAVTVFLASLVLIMGVLYGYFSQIQQTQLRMQTDLAAQGVETAGADYFDGLNIRDYRITWIGADGDVLYDSTANSSIMENHLEREEVREALSDGYGESSRYSATLMERSLYSARRLSDGSVLRLSIAQNTVLTMLLGMGQALAVVIVTALILSVLLAKRLTAHIVRPLNNIDLDDPLSNEGLEELSPLLHRLESQQKQLLLDAAEKTQTEQLRREFTANVSHELKTPLHSISGYAELMQNGMVKQADIQPFSEKIYAEAQRMIQLIEDIISLSHLDEGAGDMAFENVDLYTLAQSTVFDLQSKAEKADVTLEVSGKTATMSGIPQLLHSIVFNLCDNGIKYNRRGGKVSVHVEDDSDGVVLTVTDTGIGIPPEQQGHIFERFYRVDKSRSKGLGGTGLGLSIVKHAALIHDARIARPDQQSGRRDGDHGAFSTEKH